MTNYFLYARKSTDVEDKQVRSIDDQLAVLRALVKTEGLNIVEEFIEKQSAKMPGRPIFNEMMERIEKGEARGVAEIQWASIAEAHCLENKTPLNLIMVRLVGIEPTAFRV